MDQRIIDLYDEFTHGVINRRTFLDRLTMLAGSAAAAVALLPLLQNDYANAAIVPESDPRLAIDKTTYDSPKGKIGVYVARPKAKGKRPAVIVIHENRGRNPHTHVDALLRQRSRDVSRRIGQGLCDRRLLPTHGRTPCQERDLLHRARWRACRRRIDPLPVPRLAFWP